MESDEQQEQLMDKLRALAVAAKAEGIKCIFAAPGLIIMCVPGHEPAKKPPELPI